MQAMKPDLRNKLAAAALCLAAVCAMESPARAGCPRPKGFNQACRLLFDKKKLEATQIYTRADTPLKITLI
jgi:hypothetical protein